MIHADKYSYKIPSYLAGFYITKSCRGEYKTSINIYKKDKKEQPTKGQLQLYKRCAEALMYSIL